MNEQFITEFIRQRMFQLCVTDYHFEALVFAAPLTTEKYLLSNEIWYLVGFPKYVTIAADTAFYQSTDTATTVYGMPEFTGNLTIAATDNVTLYFIRVIIQNTIHHEKPAGANRPCGKHRSAEGC